MSRFAVATITCNPTIDVSSEAEFVRPTQKTRTYGERMDPGGGGINVARVLHRFGVPVEAIFLAGGVTGKVLDALLDRAGIANRCLPISGDTRLSLTVHERSTGEEYRFVPEGPCAEEQEWQRLVDAAAGIDCEWLVLSGSLPRCAPDDLYARIMSQFAGRPVRILLDTSGEPLRRALGTAPLFLVKPSRAELEELSGRSVQSLEQMLEAGRKIVETGQVEHVAITLGKDGALMINGEGAHHLAAVPVETRSAVGAGDSFLAAMTHALVQGAPALAAFRWGVAAGAATATTPGTDLCHPQQVEEFLTRVETPRRIA